MRSICVNCGSNSGLGSEYLEAAREVGEYCAVNGIEMVYGGASVGLMGAMADAALRNGGRVVGVITEYLNSRVGHRDLSDLIVVDTMHERKNVMFNLAEAFIVLPGGFGTLEEMFEVLTWAQLGQHNKPCGLLNVNGYFNGLINFLDRAVEHQFIKSEHRNMLLVAGDISNLIGLFLKYSAPVSEKWIIDNSKK